MNRYSCRATYTLDLLTPISFYSTRVYETLPLSFTSYEK